MLLASLNGRYQLSPWDILTLLFFILPRIFFAKIFFLIVTNSFSYIHWHFISSVRVRIHLFIQVPSVTFSMHLPAEDFVQRRAILFCCYNKFRFFSPFVRSVFLFFLCFRVAFLRFCDIMITETAGLSHKRICTNARIRTVSFFIFDISLLYPYPFRVHDNSYQDP